MGKQRNTSYKVEAKNPARRKKRAPDRGRGASGATDYLLCPRDKGRKGSCGRYAVFGSYLTHPPPIGCRVHENEEGSTMRRTILLLTTMALTLLVASGVALAVTKIGTDGPDTLSGTNRSDTLVGKGGNDTLFSRAGNDVLLGGPGKDRLVGGTRVGSAYRTQGGDKTLLGGDGNDNIIGGRGADNIAGGEGNDLLATGDLITDTADDKVAGGDGTDMINALSDPRAKAVISCGDGTDAVIVNRRDVVAADCEKVFVGRGSIDAWFAAFPEGFLEGLPPFFVFPE
jgi:hypothetical protein